MLIIPAPKTVTSIIAKRIPGKAIRESINLINISSTTPPKYPALAPTIIPRNKARATVPKDKMRAYLDPSISLDNISLPMLSVPKGWDRLGGRSFIDVSTLFGS